MRKIFISTISIIIIFSLCFQSFAGITFIDEDSGEAIAIETEATTQAQRQTETRRIEETETPTTQRKLEATVIEVADEETTTEETQRTSHVYSDDETTTAAAQTEESQSIAVAEITKETVSVTSTPEYRALAQKYMNLYNEVHVNDNVINCDNGHWENYKNNWVFYKDDGDRLKDEFLLFLDHVYYLDRDGYMATKWKFIDNAWYFFDKDGKMHKGWLEYCGYTYYLDPESGRMQQSTKYIDGNLCEFSQDGRLLTNNTEDDVERLVWAIYDKFKFVNNTKKNEKTRPEDKDIQNIQNILRRFPVDILNFMNDNLLSIKVAMHQADVKGGSKYITTVYLDNIEDLDDNDKMIQELPFMSSMTAITLDGANMDYLYYAIGSFLAKNYLDKDNNPLYKNSVWKNLCKDAGEMGNLDSLSGDWGLLFWTGNNQTTLACSIGWFYLDPERLYDACPAVFNFLMEKIKLRNQANGPATPSNIERLIDSYNQSVQDMEEDEHTRSFILAMDDDLTPKMKKEEIIPGENWRCQNPACGHINTGKYCSECGQKAPRMVD